jgi:hypothetical protein
MNKSVFFCVCALALSCSSSSGKPDSGTTGTAGGSAGTVGTAGATGGSTATSGTGGAGTTGASGTGGGGTTGASGTGGSATGAAGAIGTGGMVMTMNGPCGHLMPAQMGGSVLTRGNNVQRTAHFIEPSLTTAMVMTKFGPDTTFNMNGKFMGSLEGVPLFVAGATPGKGMYIVASHGGGNSILTAIDETSGMTLWSHTLAASGNGVRSTPVIDSKGIVYTAFDASMGGMHWEIHANSIANMGAEVAGWPINPGTIKSGNGDQLGNIDMSKEIQRGALTIVNGVLYVPFGGVFGDAPPYKGFVVAVNTANPTQTGGWSVAGDRSGLWQGGGLASDGTSIFAATSNGSDQTHLDSEEIVRITGMGASTHNPTDVFFPSVWHTWDGQDNDVGSSSPLVLQFSGQCQSMVVAPSKPGHLFFLDPTNLGGANGNTPLRELLLATNGTPNGEYKACYAAPTAYMSGTTGVHIALESRVDAACPTPGGDQLVSVTVDMTTTPPTPKVAWCAPVQGGEDRHSPISTTIDGLNSPIVWFVYNSSLYAYNGDSGSQIFMANPCGNVEKQTAPIAAEGHVVVGADGKLCSYSVQP